MEESSLNLVNNSVGKDGYLKRKNEWNTILNNCFRGVSLVNNVNSRKHVDSEKIRAPDGIWTHDPPWSSRMLYQWATGDSVVSKGQIVGID